MVPVPPNRYKRGLRRNLLRAGALVLSLILALAAGAVGLVGTFSDLGLGETPLILFLAGVYFVACASIGALMNR